MLKIYCLLKVSSDQRIIHRSKEILFWRVWFVIKPPEILLLITFYNIFNYEQEDMIDYYEGDAKAWLQRIVESYIDT
jgi:hypothetical protein